MLTKISVVRKQRQKMQVQFLGILDDVDGFLKREIGRNGDNIATVMPYCRKMIEAIERIFNRDNRAALTNHIFSIYDTLNTAFVADHGRTHRPYSTIFDSSIG